MKKKSDYEVDLTLDSGGLDYHEVEMDAEKAKKKNDSFFDNKGEKVSYKGNGE